MIRHDCEHLLDVTNDSIRQECDTCGAIYVSVWKCEIYDLCAPFVKGTINNSEIVDCNNCNQYRSNNMFCKLEKVGRMTYRCKVCGHIVGTERPQKLKLICSGERKIAPPVDEPEVNPDYCVLKKVGRGTYKCVNCGHIVGTELPHRFRGICKNPIVGTDQSEPDSEDIEPEVDTEDQEDSKPLRFLHL